MIARISAAEARALGIDTDEKPSRKRTTRRTARGPYRTICIDCGEVFTTQAAETRHVDATRHCRFDLIIDELPA